LVNYAPEIYVLSPDAVYFSCDPNSGSPPREYADLFHTLHSPRDRPSNLISPRSALISPRGLMNSGSRKFDADCSTRGRKTERPSDKSTPEKIGSTGKFKIPFRQVTISRLWGSQRSKSSIKSGKKMMHPKLANIFTDGDTTSECVTTDSLSPLPDGHLTPERGQRKIKGRSRSVGNLEDLMAGMDERERPVTSRGGGTLSRLRFPPDFRRDNKI